MSENKYKKVVDGLIKGAIEAKRLGTSLESVGKAAAGMLDFQSSINDEMEASVLFKLIVVAERFSRITLKFCLFSSFKVLLTLFKTSSKELMVFFTCSPTGDNSFIKSPSKLVAGAVFIVSPDFINNVLFP